jgi:hypothetical protein
VPRAKATKPTTPLRMWRGWEHQALTVFEDASDLKTAVTRAAHKMQRLLESTFGRIESKRPVLATE